MTAAPPSRSGFRLALTAAAFAVGATAVIALGIGGGGSTSSNAPGGGGSAVAVGSPTVAPPPSPTAPALRPQATVSCTPDIRTVPPALASDPCPSAILAVELAIAPIRLPVKRMVVEPGPLYCGVIWEGVVSPAPACRSAYIPPGTSMHAYVSFADSPKVAVVELGLDLPDPSTSPLATRPPWLSTLVALDVPPAGWVMP